MSKRRDLAAGLDTVKPGPAVKSGYAIEWQVIENRIVFMSLDASGANTWLEWNEAQTVDETVLKAMRIQMLGSEFRLKVWDDGDAEPGSWLLSRSDETTYTTGEFGFTGTGSFADPGTPTPFIVDSFVMYDSDQG